MKWSKRAATKKRHLWHRKPLALPYDSPPTGGSPTFDPSLHTAAELMYDRQTHVA